MAVGQQRRAPAALAAQRVMPDRVDRAVQLDQATALDPVPHGRLRYPDGEKLGKRHDPKPTARDLNRSTKPVTIARNVDHDPSVAAEGVRGTRGLCRNK